AGQIESGDLRVLAVSSAERQEGIDAPTMREAGVDLALANWRGVVAPPNISGEARDALAAAADAMAHSADRAEALARLGWTSAYMGGDEFAAYLQEEDARVTEILREIGLVD